MTKKEVLNTCHEVVAYYSGYSGIEIYYLNDNEVYYTSGAWTGHKFYHKSKIYFTLSGEPYFKYKGRRIQLSECIRTNL